MTVLSVLHVKMAVFQIVAAVVIAVLAFLAPHVDAKNAHKIVILRGL